MERRERERAAYRYLATFFPDEQAQVRATLKLLSFSDKTIKKAFSKLVAGATAIIPQYEDGVSFPKKLTRATIEGYVRAAREPLRRCLHQYITESKGIVVDIARIADLNLSDNELLDQLKTDPRRDGIDPDDGDTEEGL